jgi:mRNA-degrading endonuclease toxin of MazEF toxin-antitoxin module
VDRGDIYRVDLNPIQGREQAGQRYVLVVSPRPFNVLGTPIVCPITQGGNFAREQGFAVSLMGTGLTTQGVVLCHQLRALDAARRAALVERAPAAVVDEVLSRVVAIFE